MYSIVEGELCDDIKNECSQHITIYYIDAH